MNSIEVTRSSKEVDQLVQDFEKNRARKDIPALSDALNQNKLDVAQGLIDRKANVNEYAKNPDGQLGMAPSIRKVARSRTDAGRSRGQD